MNSYRLRPLVEQDLAMFSYDMTTIRATSLSEQEGDLRHYGMAKQGVIARQVMLGVVQTSEGLPLYREVFEGNTAEVYLCGFGVWWRYDVAIACLPETDGL